MDLGTAPVAANSPLFIPTMACLLATFQNGTRSYEGYNVFRLNGQKERHFETIQNYFFNDEYEFLTPPSRILPTDMLIPPSLVASTKDLLRITGIPFEISITNLQELIDKQKSWVAPRQAELSWTSYHRLETIHNWMNAMVNRYPTIVSIQTIGESSEGRPIKVMKISSGTQEPDAPPKPAIWLDGGIHAREWISPATVTYMANELINMAVKKRSSSMIENFDWYIQPVMNPDGYEYTHTSDRMWRKTRSGPGRPIFGGLLGCCKGTDPNRNWDYKWGGKGTSDNLCSQTYHGPKPASEPEVKLIQDFVFARKDQIKLFLTFHSYSQMILLPWSYDNIRTDDHAILQTVGDNAANALKSVHGTQYKVGPTPEILYAAAGGSHDWAKGVAGIKFAYCYELRDKGDFGFLLPPNQIIPSGQETFQGVKSMVDNLMTYYRIGSKKSSNIYNKLFH